jgi:hypothetical protein
MKNSTNLSTVQSIEKCKHGEKTYRKNQQ